MRRAASLPVFLALALGSIAPPHAHADDRAEAEGYFRRGNELFVEGRYEDAARAFKVCVALAPRLAGPYRRLGQTYKALGRCSEAVDQFLSYLELKPAGKYAEDIRRAMEECASEARLDTPDVGLPVTGRVELDVDEEGARVRLNGEAIGRTPLSAVALKPGRYRLNVSKDGFEAQELDVEVVAGRVARREVRLEPMVGGRITTPGRLSLAVEPPGARIFVDGDLVGAAPVADLDLPAGQREVRVEMKGYLTEVHTVDLRQDGQASLRVSLVRVGVAPSDAVARPSVEMAAPAPPEEDATAGRRGVGWVLVAAGVVAALSGAVAGGMALGKSTDYRDAAATMDRSGLKEDGEALALIADVSFASAALLAGGGVLLLLGNPPPAPKPPPPRLDDVLEARRPRGASPVAAVTLRASF